MSVTSLDARRPTRYQRAVREAQRAWVCGVALAAIPMTVGVRLACVGICIVLGMTVRHRLH